MLQTLLERRSVAVFLMIANLTENPLLCVREQTIQCRGAGAPFPGSAVKGEGGRKRGEKRNRVGGIKSTLRKVIGYEWGGAPDCTVIKRQNNARVGERRARNKRERVKKMGGGGAE